MIFYILFSDLQVLSVGTCDTFLQIIIYSFGIAFRQQVLSKKAQEDKGRFHCQVDWSIQKDTGKPSPYNKNEAVSKGQPRYRKGSRNCIPTAYCIRSLPHWWPARLRNARSLRPNLRSHNNCFDCYQLCELRFDFAYKLRKKYYLSGWRYY